MPIEALNSEMNLDKYKNLLDFLKVLKSSNLFDDGEVPGRVIYADDQFVN